MKPSLIKDSSTGQCVFCDPTKNTIVNGVCKPCDLTKNTIINGVCTACDLNLNKIVNGVCVKKQTCTIGGQVLVSRRYDTSSVLFLSANSIILFTPVPCVAALECRWRVRLP